MSAAEIIEQIKSLPEAEKQKVREFLREDEQVQYVSKDEVLNNTREIFSKHKLLFTKLAQ